MNCHRLLCFLPLIITCVSAEFVCSELTFKDNVVAIHELDRTHRKTVTGCISGQSLLLKNLKRIVVKDQQIHALYRGAVSNIPHPFELTLVNNRITTIRKEAFLNIGAHSINLNCNNLKWVERYSFNNLTSLEVIDLDYNKIQTMPKCVFHNLENLTIVSIAHNALNDFDQDWFSGTPKLEMLFLNNNRLRNIPRAGFSKFENLRGITLEENWIDYIDPQAFKGTSQLNELYLSNNRIQYLDLDFSHIPSIKVFNIDGNQLTHLPLDNLKAIESSLRQLNIHANPWQCPCFDEMAHWADTHNIKMPWRCKGIDLFCYVPQQQSAQCLNRTDTDLDSNFRQFSIQNCHKIL
uniref:LRRCT domain-containing protein n=1 Tax=Photinus pyralis TaxID=7054 RepID=A0A1Y1L310_PHOPY